MAKFKKGDRVSTENRDGFPDRGEVVDVHEGHYRGTGYDVKMDNGGKRELYENEIIPEVPRSNWATGGDKPAKKKGFFSR